MSCLIIVLKGLSVVFLSMEGPGQMVTAVSSHGLVFRVMEGMQSQMLDFGKILMSIKSEVFRACNTVHL